MKFSDMQYTRPDMDKISAEFKTLVGLIQKASSSQDQLESIRRINIIRENFSTMVNLAYIRNTINTGDQFYEDEKAFFDEFSPLFNDRNNDSQESKNSIKICKNSSK